MDGSKRQEIVGPVRETSEPRRGRAIQLQAVGTLASGPATSAGSFEAFFTEIVRSAALEIVSQNGATHVPLSP